MILLTLVRSHRTRQHLQTEILGQALVAVDGSIKWSQHREEHLDTRFNSAAEWSAGTLADYCQLLLVDETSEGGVSRAGQLPFDP